MRRFQTVIRTIKLSATKTFQGVSRNGDHCNQIVALRFHQHARQTPFDIKATPKGGYAVDITYRPAECEDLGDAERVVQEAGNELRVRLGRRPWPAPPPIAFPKFCLAGTLPGAGSPVGGCASSASTGIDARCGGPDVSDA